VPNFTVVVNLVKLPQAVTYRAYALRC